MQSLIEHLPRNSKFKTLRIKNKRTGQDTSIENKSWCKIRQTAEGKYVFEILIYGSSALLTLIAEEVGTVKVESFLPNPLFKDIVQICIGGQLVETVAGGVSPLRTVPEPPKPVRIAPPPLPALPKPVKVELNMQKVTEFLYVPYPDPPTFPEYEVITKKGLLPPDKNYVSIVMLNWNGSEWTIPCIKSIIEKSVYPYEILVIDNASEDEDVERLKTILKENTPYPIRIYLQKKRCGFDSASNFGIHESEGRYIMLLNNDTIVTTDRWLFRLVECAESDPEIGIVGCRLIYPDGRLQFSGTDAYERGETTYLTWHPMQTATLVHPDEFTESHDSPAVTYAMAFFKRKLLDKIGYLDEARFYSGCEDPDHCFRAWLAGFRVVYCGEVTLIHLESVTDRKMGVQKTKVQTLNDKWHQVHPQFFNYIHSYVRDRMMEYHNGKWIRVQVKDYGLDRDWWRWREPVSWGPAPRKA